MPRKTKAPSDRPPVYVTRYPNLDELKKRGDPFAHPWIQVGHRYGDDGQDYFWHDFTVEFQVSLTPNSDGTVTSDGHAYGGTLVNLRLGQVYDVTSIIKRVQAKVQLLAPGQPDEYFKLIVGLRGAGFKEAVMKVGEYPRIAVLR